MTDEIRNEPAIPGKTENQVLADEAKKRSEQENRRRLEIRAAFYDRLSALSAGSIAITISVGIALLEKSDSRFGSVHSHLTWLLSIAACLLTSLFCSIGHNFLHVRIAQLEADQAELWSSYLSLLGAIENSRQKQAERSYATLLNLLSQTHQKRRTDLIKNVLSTEQGVHRGHFLGVAAVVTFLFAYTLVMLAFVRLWWIARC